MKLPILFVRINVLLICLYIVIVLSPFVALNGDSEKFSATLITSVRATTIQRAIQKRSHDPLYKTNRKDEVKKLRAKSFAIAKLEER